MNEQTASPTLAQHGALVLPAVTVEGYNAEIRDGRDSFVGDRANDRAFRDIIEDLRSRLREVDEDPLGDAGPDLGKKKLDKALEKGSLEAKGVIQAAIEAFSEEFAAVIRRFLELDAWRGTERIVVGGGMSWSRVGELVVARTAVALKTAGINIGFSRIRHPSDEAGLVGAVQLTPAWTLEGFDGILAVDIGGTKMRTGVIRLNLDEEPDFAAACVWKYEVWRHADESPSRDETVARLTDMLRNLVRKAEKQKLKLAPFIGIGCPGMIREDGCIERGAQNLPGNWETDGFNLPQRIRDALPSVGGHAVTVVMHNDAVVQGLSEVPFLREVGRWGIMTIGTGLGNAVFTNRPAKG